MTLKVTLPRCQVQHVGLQVAYNNPDDREVKIGAHMLLALAFIPPDEVKDVFKDLVRILPNELKPVVKYMKENYVVGTPSTRGRRRTIPPRYPVPLWNMYEATRTGQHRTNNISEGWHNRFRSVPFLTLSPPSPAPWVVTCPSSTPDW